MLTVIPFSSRLRTATVADHGHAESSAFMTAVMNGRIPGQTYTALLVQLRQIYAALDSAAATHRQHPVFGSFFDPVLERSVALDSDLEHFGWPDHAVTGATQAYVTRLMDTADDPLLVLAHHYTRYLGDLSGGRAIAARLQQNLGLTPDAGVAFYQFDIGPAPAYKNTYRQRLDDLDLPAERQQRFIAEVITAYALNAGVFASLDHLL